MHPMEETSRSEYSKEGKNPPRHKKFVKVELDKPPGPHRNKPTEVFVGNLPMDVKEAKEPALLFKDFRVKSVKKCQPSSESFGFEKVTSPEASQWATQPLNGNLLNGQRITATAKEDQKVHQPSKDNSEMPVSHEGFSCRIFDILGPPPPQYGKMMRNAIKTDATRKTGTQNLPPLEQKVHHAVPIEMRSLFLLHMLKDCFKDVSWLLSVAKVAGKVGLLVMESFPQTPYFWAINLTEESHQKMQKLFTDLGEAESRLPYVTKKDAYRGMRCLAECIVGDEGKAWNRCWVLEKIEDLAVVFFVDFGHSATIPLTSLRKLDMDEFWSISPLAQPFVLQDEVLPPQVMRRQILEGTVAGPLQREPHILKFILQAD